MRHTYSVPNPHSPMLRCSHFLSLPIDILSPNAWVTVTRTDRLIHWYHSSLSRHPPPSSGPSRRDFIKENTRQLWIFHAPDPWWPHTRIGPLFCCLTVTARINRPLVASPPL